MLIIFFLGSMGVGAHWAGGGLYLVKLGVGELADGFLGASLGAEDVVGEVVGHARSHVEIAYVIHTGHSTLSHTAQGYHP